MTIEQNSIAFVDTEVEPKTGKIIDIGGIKDNGNTFHRNSIDDFMQFLNGIQFICGHNILRHDIKFIGKTLGRELKTDKVIDTLFLSPLLFPTKPYHRLLKDDKLQTEELNNPLNDSIKARDLFNDEIAEFKKSDKVLQQIFFLLLNDISEFHAFFDFISYTTENRNVEQIIRGKFKNEICENTNLAQIISKNPIELAYSLSLIDSFINHKEIHSITPPWVIKNYPDVELIMSQLRKNFAFTILNIYIEKQIKNDIGNYCNYNSNSNLFDCI